MSGGDVIELLQRVELSKEVTLGLVLINLAYIALLFGALATSINRVRTLLVMAAGLFVAYGLLESIFSLVLWNIVIGGLHLFRMSTDVLARTPARVTPEQRAFRQHLFPDLSLREFHSLWDLGQDVWYVDQPLGGPSAFSNRLYVVLRGTVHTELDQDVQVLRAGSVIGEIEPDDRDLPAANHRAVGPVWLRAWEHADLRGTPDACRRALLSLEQKTGPALLVAA